VKIKLNTEQYLNDDLRAKAKVKHSLSTIRRHKRKVEIQFHSSSALELELYVQGP